MDSGAYDPVLKVGSTAPTWLSRTASASSSLRTNWRETTCTAARNAKSFATVSNFQRWTIQNCKKLTNTFLSLNFKQIFNRSLSCRTRCASIWSDSGMTSPSAARSAPKWFFPFRSSTCHHGYTETVSQPRYIRYHYSPSSWLVVRSVVDLDSLNLDPAFQLNPDTVPDPGFWWPKINICLIKTCNLLIPRPP